MNKVRSTGGKTVSSDVEKTEVLNKYFLLSLGIRKIIHLYKVCSGPLVTGENRMSCRITF